MITPTERIIGITVNTIVGIFSFFYFGNEFREFITKPRYKSTVVIDSKSQDYCNVTNGQVSKRILFKAENQTFNDKDQFKDIKKAEILWNGNLLVEFNVRNINSNKTPTTYFMEYQDWVVYSLGEETIRITKESYRIKDDQNDTSEY